MAQQKQITVHCIAQTRLNKIQIEQWLDSIGVSKDFRIPDKQSDAAVLTGLLGKRCYNSFELGLNPNVSKIREDWTKYLDNIMRSGHGSVIANATWTWAIEGCTRVFTAEANRHTAGVQGSEDRFEIMDVVPDGISEGSLRYIRFESDGIGYWMPRLLEEMPYVSPEQTLAIMTEEDKRTHYRTWQSREIKKGRTRYLFHQTFRETEKAYRQLCEIWAEELAPDSSFAEKKALTSMFRRIVPMGVSTGVVYTLNARALRHVMTMRCSPSAEEEIAWVFGMIARHMFSWEPQLFGDFEQTNGFWHPRYIKV